MNFSGKNSNVFTGLDIDEYSGTSEGQKEATPTTADHREIDSSFSTLEVHNIWDPPPAASHQEVNNPPVIDLQSGMNYRQLNTIDYTNIANLNDLGTMEIFTVDSKASLQIDLLRQQIEYAKRDILLLELKILEKERSLLLTEQEKSRILQNCENKFINRKEI